MSLELEQAKNEIAALQRRLTEYAAEVERLKELGRDCYVDASDKSTLNALETCRQEREKLREGAKQMVSCLHHIKQTVLTCREDPKIVLSAVGLSAIGGLSFARELGLPEKEE
jgi:hypothetical protein